MKNEAFKVDPESWAEAQRVWSDPKLKLLDLDEQIELIEQAELPDLREALLNRLSSKTTNASMFFALFTIILGLLTVANAYPAILPFVSIACGILLLVFGVLYFVSDRQINKEQKRLLNEFSAWSVLLTMLLKKRTEEKRKAKTKSR